MVRTLAECADMHTPVCILLCYLLNNQNYRLFYLSTLLQYCFSRCFVWLIRRTILAFRIEFYNFGPLLGVLFGACSWTCS